MISMFIGLLELLGFVELVELLAPVDSKTYKSRYSVRTGTIAEVNLLIGSTY